MKKIEKAFENKNWNEEWEKNYDPVEINKHCTVRAPFHKPSKKIYDIIIKPEMSFGTGHHETTQLMIDFLFDQNLVNKKICDVGCGTGILSIIAEKTGAIEVDAVDIALNCIENTIDNNFNPINIDFLNNLGMFYSNIYKFNNNNLLEFYDFINCKSMLLYMK